MKLQELRCLLSRESKVFVEGERVRLLNIEQQFNRDGRCVTIEITTYLRDQSDSESTETPLIVNVPPSDLPL